jgi:transposase-like protein
MDVKNVHSWVRQFKEGRGRTFSSHSALATAIFQWSEGTPKEAFAAAMQLWRERCEKCVCLQGDYIEK